MLTLTPHETLVRGGPVSIKTLGVLIGVVRFVRSHLAPHAMRSTLANL